MSSFSNLHHYNNQPAMKLRCTSKLVPVKSPHVWITCWRMTYGLRNPLLQPFLLAAILDLLWTQKPPKIKGNSFWKNACTKSIASVTLAFLSAPQVHGVADSRLLHRLLPHAIVPASPQFTEPSHLHNWFLHIQFALNWCKNYTHSTMGQMIHCLVRWCIVSNQIS